MDAGELWMFLFAVAILAILIGLPLAAVGARRRWGSVRVEAGTQGEGVYRGGTASTDEARGTPPIVAVASMAAAIWGVLTLFVFVPGGILSTAIFFEQPSVLSVAAGIASVLVVLSGIALAVRTGRLSVSLVRRWEGAREQTRSVVRHSTYHHGAVFVTYGLGSLAIAPVFSDGLGLAVTTLVPCGLGLLVGRGLSQAEAALAEVERAEKEADEGTPPA